MKDWILKQIDALRKWFLAPGKGWRTWLGHSIFTAIITSGIALRGDPWEGAKGAMWFYGLRELDQLSRRHKIAVPDRPPWYDYFMDFFVVVVTGVVVTALWRL